MRSIFCAAAIVATMPITTAAQAPPRSATVARDIGGYSLGTPIADVQKRMTLSQIARETYAGTDGDIAYEFGFTPMGRVFRIHAVQKLGQFIPDAKFVQTISGRLTDKFGPPASNTLPDGAMSWELIENVGPQNSRTLPFRTMWMDAMLSHDAGDVTLNLTMLDFRLLWADQNSLNQTPRQQAEDEARF